MKHPNRTRNDDELCPSGESWGVARKKMLFLILAQREAARIGIEISEEEISAVSRELQKEYGLAEPQEMTGFLEEGDISEHTFMQFMRDFACVKRLESLFSSLIDEHINGYIAVSSARKKTMR